MAFTSVLGVADGKLANIVLATVGEDVPEGPTKNRTATSTLSLSQTVARIITVARPAQNSFILTQVANVEGPISVSGSNTISLTQSSLMSLYLLTALNALPLTQVASGSLGLFNRDASNTINLSQSVSSGFFALSASNTLELTQAASRVHIKTTNIELTGSNTLACTQTALRVKILPTAISLDATNTIVFSQNGTLPLEFSETNTLVLSQTAANFKVHSATNTLVLTHIDDTVLVRNDTGSNTIGINHTFTLEHCDSNGAPKDGLKKYSPIVGQNDNPNAPAPPDVTAPIVSKLSTVEFTYPASGTPTDVVNIRAPVFGDRNRLLFDRIQRETRGGTLEIFRDSNWPEQQTLNILFVGLKESDAQDLLSFIETSLGDEILFRDWENMFWTGIITNPDTAIIRNSKAGVDVSIEMEVEINALSQSLTTESGTVITDESNNPIEVV